MQIDSPSIESNGADSTSPFNVILYANSGGTTTINYGLYDQEYSYDPNYETCNETDYNYPQTATATVLVPTATRTVSTIYSQATSSCPAGQAGWDRKVYKIVTDKSGADIIAEGQQLTEGVTINALNDLILPTDPQTFTATTNSVGQFTDRLAFCSSVCPGSTSETDATQVIGDTYLGVRYILTPNTFVYKCSANTINGN
jgi:hypothetical protein